jgi:hypothetical protein
MSAHAGRSGAVYIAIESATGVATTTIKLNAWTVNRTTDKFEVTAFGDSNKTYVQGLPDVQGTISGSWDDSETKVFAGASSSTGVKLYLYPDITNSPTKYAYGTAWLDASIETPVSGAVTISGNFAAAGSWYFGL